ncbi:ROK family protein [Candidatus Bathyarchaeota archaeon]|nr:ROK family protein [Candidatus Bathyarchaeota archaeon]
MKAIHIAVDLGATRVRVAAGDGRGLRYRIVEETDRRHGPEGVARQIIRMIRTLEVEVEAIGVGSIGPLDLSRGCVINTPNLPFDEIPIVEPLEEAFGVEVRLLNDCSAAVLGEKHFGAGRGLRNLVYITLSTGLGGGAIVDGHLLLGKDGNAVEIGHLTIDPDSELICGCGCRGHWEAYCSGRNIPNYARLLLRDRGLGDGLLNQLTGGDPGRLTTELIFKAARMGDETALWIVDRIGFVNAVGFADVVNAYDPELITVGGSIALRNPRLILEPIEGYIDEYLINRKPRIMLTPLGDEAVLYGALALSLWGFS